VPDLVPHLALFVAAFVAMEGVAYLTHRHVMHGCLWSLHKGHHQPRSGPFEKNDLFAFFFALPSIVLIYFGVNHFAPLVWIGLGMTAYGVMYFLFHDVIVHQRLRFRSIPRFGYLRRIMQAHRMHHARSEKEGGVSFGFLYAPPIQKLKAAQAAAGEG
jgi:beta-carotene 3-hydroxylase